MKKRILALSLIVFILGSVAGCGEKKNTSQNKEEKITISWMGMPGNGSPEEGTEVEKLIEEKFDVEIKPVFYASSNYNDKKTMLMAGGEIPDVIYEMDPSFVANDIKQGFLAQVNYKTVKEYAPTIYETIKKEAPKSWIYTRYEDKNYGIPNLNYNNSYGRLGLWRMDWLKNVGIEKVPETIDEMHDAFLKFVNNDPDGNGKKDTFAMTGDIQRWNTMFTEIFGAYGILPCNWMEQNGKIVYGGFADGIEDALDTLSLWYKEGIIHPDFVSDNSFSTAKEKFISGAIGYINQNGGYIDPNDSKSVAALTAQSNPSAIAVSSKFVKGPDGKSGTQAWGVPCHIVSFGQQLDDNTDKLGKILSIFEGVIKDKDFLQRIQLGEEGVQWKFIDSQKGFSGGYEWIPPYDDYTQRCNNCLPGDFGGPSFFVPLTPERNDYLSHITADRIAFNKEYKTEENGLTDIFLKPDTLPSSGDYFEDLRTQQINLIAKVIKGEITSKQYINDFEKIWKNNGGTILEEEAQGMKKTIEEMLNDI